MTDKRKKTTYDVDPFDDVSLPDLTDDDDDIGSWGGPGSGGGSSKPAVRPTHRPTGRGKIRRPSVKLPSLPLADAFGSLGDAFSHLAWYDMIFGPVTILLLIMILLNLDAVLLSLARMTVRLLDVSIVILLVAVVILIFLAWIRGRRDRRDRRRGWF